jgi:hypothetical protein
MWPVLNTLKLKIPLQGNFSRAAPHNQGLGSSRNGDRVSGRWLLMIPIDISMEMGSELVLW